MKYINNIYNKIFKKIAHYTISAIRPPPNRVYNWYVSRLLIKIIIDKVYFLFLDNGILF